MVMVVGLMFLVRWLLLCEGSLEFLNTLTTTGAETQLKRGSKKSAKESQKKGGGDMAVGK